MTAPSVPAGPSVGGLRCSDASTEAARRRASMVFETDDVVVRPYSLRTLRDLRLIASVPDVHRWLFLGAELSDAHLRMVTRYERRRWFLTGRALCMAYGSTGELLGICGFRPLTLVEGLEVVIAVVPEARHTPIVIELYRALLDYGFGVLAQPTLFALSVAGHPTSRRFTTNEGAVFVRGLDLTGVAVDLLELSPASVAAARRSAATSDRDPQVAHGWREPIRDPGLSSNDRTGC